MKTIEKTDEKIVISEEINESLANAIRRSVLEIPILAIDEIEFHKNDSVLYDEVLALRLGLIPLKTPKNMTLPEKCTCKGKGCSKCQVQLKINVKGPVIVKAGDIKGKADIVYSDMPLVILKEGQELELIAYAKLGLGKNHTKFSPGLVYYRNFAEIEKIDKKSLEGKKVVEIDEKELEDIKKENSDKAADFIDEVVKAGDEYFYIKPGKEIIFYIESYGMISSKEILEQAVKALKDNLKQLK